jgi:hypothetical protein
VQYAGLAGQHALPEAHNLLMLLSPACSPPGRLSMLYAAMW